MPSPQQQCDRATHRVADWDHRFEPEFVDEAGGVIGAVGQTERFAGANPESVTTVVHGHYAKMSSECFVDTEPVEIGRCGPAVQQKNRGCIGGRGGQLADECRSPSGKIDRPARR